MKQTEMWQYVVTVVCFAVIALVFVRPKPTRRYRLVQYQFDDTVRYMVQMRHFGVWVDIIECRTSEDGFRRLEECASPRMRKRQTEAPIVLAEAHMRGRWRY